jgi:hypothetical protein
VAETRLIAKADKIATIAKSAAFWYDGAGFQRFDSDRHRKSCFSAEFNTIVITTGRASFEVTRIAQFSSPECGIKTAVGVSRRLGWISLQSPKGDTPLANMCRPPGYHFISTIFRGLTSPAVYMSPSGLPIRATSKLTRRV